MGAATTWWVPFKVTQNANQQLALAARFGNCFFSLDMPLASPSTSTRVQGMLLCLGSSSLHNHLETQLMCSVPLSSRRLNQATRLQRQHCLIWAFPLLRLQEFIQRMLPQAYRDLAEKGGEGTDLLARGAHAVMQVPQELLPMLAEQRAAREGGGPAAGPGAGAFTQGEILQLPVHARNAC